MPSKKFLYILAADTLFVLHLILFLIVVFGWSIESIWGVYMTLLVLTLLSDIIFGYCLLSKWEFDLRKKIDPSIDYNFTWSTFYTHKFTANRIPDKLFKHVALSFLVISLSMNIYFKFLH
jgi:Protein of Unknown function (DUF2784)